MRFWIPIHSLIFYKNLRFLHEKRKITLNPNQNQDADLNRGTQNIWIQCGSRSEKRIDKNYSGSESSKGLLEQQRVQGLTDFK